MLEKLKDARVVVGTKQLQRALEADQIRSVYVAYDAEPYVTRRIRDLCQARRVALYEVPSMKELGRACGIDVGTAAAGILR